MYSHVQQIECLRFILKANVYSQLLHKYRLKEVRNLVWEIRSKWEDLGIELDLSPDSREVGVYVLVWVLPSCNYKSLL